MRHQVHVTREVLEHVAGEGSIVDRAIRKAEFLVERVTEAGITTPTASLFTAAGVTVAGEGGAAAPRAPRGDRRRFEAGWDVAFGTGE